ncbi:uncharacterized protein LOC131953551 [Physella acuta]|uniref:uncharacterized protein LOC131953551 n=1 Tax=Physella acuta TaxID=109671 RepID=UPI0027DCD7FA|nr:uncharacterized protein LOC131953551 [Physella acuta]
MSRCPKLCYPIAPSKACCPPSCPPSCPSSCPAFCRCLKCTPSSKGSGNCGKCPAKPDRCPKRGSSKPKKCATCCCLCCLDKVSQTPKCTSCYQKTFPSSCSSTFQVRGQGVCKPKPRPASACTSPKPRKACCCLPAICRDNSRLGAGCSKGGCGGYTPSGWNKLMTKCRLMQEQEAECTCTPCTPCPPKRKPRCKPNPCADASNSQGAPNAMGSSELSSRVCTPAPFQSALSFVPAVEATAYDKDSQVAHDYWARVLSHAARETNEVSKREGWAWGCHSPESFGQLSSALASAQTSSILDYVRDQGEGYDEITSKVRQVKQWNILDQRFGDMYKCNGSHDKCAPNVVDCCHDKYAQNVVDCCHDKCAQNVANNAVIRGDNKCLASGNQVHSCKLHKTKSSCGKKSSSPPKIDNLILEEVANFDPSTKAHIRRQVADRLKEEIQRAKICIERETTRPRSYFNYQGKEFILGSQANKNIVIQHMDPDHVSYLDKLDETLLKKCIVEDDCTTTNGIPHSQDEMKLIKTKPATTERRKKVQKKQKRKNCVRGNKQKGNCRSTDVFERLYNNIHSKKLNAYCHNGAEYKQEKLNAYTNSHDRTDYEQEKRNDYSHDKTDYQEEKLNNYSHDRTDYEQEKRNDYSHDRTDRLLQDFPWTKHHLNASHCHHGELNFNRSMTYDMQHLSDRHADEPHPSYHMSLETQDTDESDVNKRKFTQLLENLPDNLSTLESKSLMKNVVSILQKKLPSEDGRPWCESSLNDQSSEAMTYKYRTGQLQGPASGYRVPYCSDRLNELKQRLDRRCHQDDWCNTVGGDHKAFTYSSPLSHTTLMPHSSPIPHSSLVAHTSRLTHTNHTAYNHRQPYNQPPDANNQPCLQPAFSHNLRASVDQSTDSSPDRQLFDNLPPTMYKIPPTMYKIPPTMYEIPPTLSKMQPNLYLSTADKPPCQSHDRHVSVWPTSTSPHRHPTSTSPHRHPTSTSPHRHPTSQTSSVPAVSGALSPLGSAYRHQPPTLCHQPPTHGHQPPTHGHQPPTHGHQPPTLCHQPPTHGHQPPTHGHQPTTHGHQPPILGYQDIQPLRHQSSTDHLRHQSSTDQLRHQLASNTSNNIHSTPTTGSSQTPTNKVDQTLKLPSAAPTNKVDQTLKLSSAAPLSNQILEPSLHEAHQQPDLQAGSRGLQTSFEPVYLPTNAGQRKSPTSSNRSVEETVEPCQKNASARGPPSLYPHGDADLLPTTQTLLSKTDQSKRTSADAGYDLRSVRSARSLSQQVEAGNVTSNPVSVGINTDQSSLTNPPAEASGRKSTDPSLCTTDDWDNFTTARVEASVASVDLDALSVSVDTLDNSISLTTKLAEVKANFQDNSIEHAKSSVKLSGESKGTINIKESSSMIKCPHEKLNIDVEHRASRCSVNSTATRSRRPGSCGRNGVASATQPTGKCNELTQVTTRNTGRDGSGVTPQTNGKNVIELHYSPRVLETTSKAAQEQTPRQPAWPTESCRSSDWRGSNHVTGVNENYVVNSKTPSSETKSRVSFASGDNVCVDFTRDNTNKHQTPADNTNKHQTAATKDTMMTSGDNHLPCRCLDQMVHSLLNIRKPDLGRALSFLENFSPITPVDINTKYPLLISNRRAGGRGEIELSDDDSTWTTASKSSTSCRNDSLNASLLAQTHDQNKTDSAHQRINQQLEMNQNQQLEPQLNQQLEPQLNQQLEPQLNQQLELQQNQKLEPQQRLNSQPKLVTPKREQVTNTPSQNPSSAEHVRSTGDPTETSTHEQTRARHDTATVTHLDTTAETSLSFSADNSKEDTSVSGELRKGSDLAGPQARDLNYKSTTCTSNSKSFDSETSVARRLVQRNSKSSNQQSSVFRYPIKMKQHKDEPQIIYLNKFEEFWTATIEPDLPAAHAQRAVSSSSRRKSSERAWEPGSQRGAAYNNNFRMSPQRTKFIQQSTRGFKPESGWRSKVDLGEVSQSRVSSQVKPHCGHQHRPCQDQAKPRQSSAVCHRESSHEQNDVMDSASSPATKDNSAERGAVKDKRTSQRCARPGVRQLKQNGVNVQKVWAEEPPKARKTDGARSGQKSNCSREARHCSMDETSIQNFNNIKFWCSKYRKSRTPEARRNSLRAYVSSENNHQSKTETYSGTPATSRRLAVSSHKKLNNDQSLSRTLKTDLPKTHRRLKPTAIRTSRVGQYQTSPQRQKKNVKGESYGNVVIIDVEDSRVSKPVVVKTYSADSAVPVVVKTYDTLRSSPKFSVRTIQSSSSAGTGSQGGRTRLVSSQSYTVCANNNCPTWSSGDVKHDKNCPTWSSCDVKHDKNCPTWSSCDVKHDKNCPTWSSGDVKHDKNCPTWSSCDVKHDKNCPTWSSCDVKHDKNCPTWSSGDVKHDKNCPTWSSGDVKHDKNCPTWSSGDVKHDTNCPTWSSGDVKHDKNCPTWSSGDVKHDKNCSHKQRPMSTGSDTTSYSADDSSDNTDESYSGSDEDDNSSECSSCSTENCNTNCCYDESEDKKKRPSLKILGELAFQLERRILDYVFGMEDTKRKRFYGYTVGNIFSMMERESKNPRGGSDAITKSELVCRLRKLMVGLEKYGYNIKFHAEFAQEIVNKYGLLACPPDQVTIEEFRLNDPLAISTLIQQLAQGPSEMSHLNVLLNSLVYLSNCDHRPLFIW